MYPKSESKGCEHCLDPGGDLCYPYYGARPHNHKDKLRVFQGCIDSDKDELLPENFEIDPDDPEGYLGTYTHCPKCGAH